MTTIVKKFFHFSQNNSGGTFTCDPERGIGHNLWMVHYADGHIEKIKATKAV